MITDEKVIYAQIDKATDMDGTYHGMSYEQGVKDALEWILNPKDCPAPLNPE